MTINAFKSAVVSNLISMASLERQLNQESIMGGGQDGEKSRAIELARVQRENERAIRMAQAALMGTSLDIMV